MAKTDIMGLLTGVSSQGIDPMASASFRERQLQLGAETAKKVQGAVRGLFNVGPTAQEKILQAAGRKQEEEKQMIKNFFKLSPEEQKGVINALRAKGDSRSLSLAGQLATQLRQTEADVLTERRLTLQEKQQKAQEERLLAGDREAIRKASEASAKAGARASQLLGLADDYARVRPAGGILGSAYSRWTKTFGTQGEVDRIKTQFQAIVNTDIINNLPPGVASDKDIEMAKSGYMNPSWNAEEIEMFLRGQAKLAAYAAEREDAKATWMEENRGSLAGFNSFWRDTIEQEGYKEEIRNRYNLPAYDIPLPDVEFNPSLVPTGEPKEKTLTRRGFR